MLYDVTLRISYSFSGRAASGRQILRLLPKSVTAQQRVVAASLDILPRPSERRDGRDFFGNRIVETAHQHVEEPLLFKVKARVNRMADPGGLDLSPSLSALPVALQRHRSLDPESPHHFTGPSARIRPDAAIDHYARGLVQPGMTVLQVIEALNRALFADMDFDAEATDVNTPASLAFAHRHGVCQDFTHIMITALRALGIPAGYVSGLIRTRPPEGKARLEGADAMHAWVMAWAGEEAGWVEFDPTNGIRVAQEHVVIAHGRDYADVSPVSGVLKTTGRQETSQAVDLVAVEG